MRPVCAIAVALTLTACGREAARETATDHSSEPRLFNVNECSPAELLARNDDGTLLLKIRPRPHASYGESETIERAEDEGVYYSLSFRIEDVSHAAGWTVPSESPFPPWLNSEKEFRYLVRPWRKSAERNLTIFCTVLTVWEGDKLILDHVEGQPEPPQAIQPEG